MKIFISNNAAELTATLSTFASTATVEAEYGSEVVEGSVLTLAHHGARASRPCPCSLDNLPDLGIEVIGISHLDLDTLGGIMAIMGIKPVTSWESTQGFFQDGFWELASQIDIEGIHKVDPKGPLWSMKIDPTGESEVTVGDLLNAWYAFSEDNRIVPPRDGSVAELDLSQFFSAIEAIFDGEENIIHQGSRWFSAKKALEKDSFIEESEGVVLRESGQFVNHLYGWEEPCGACYSTLPEGCRHCFGMKHSGVAKAVVAFNTQYKSVTVSLADPIEGVNCCEIVQQLWGPEAGGHAGIAGSPRGREMTEEDSEAAFKAVKAAIKAAGK